MPWHVRLWQFEVTVFGAILVTSNLRDFRMAQQRLGLRVLTPTQFLELLAE